MSVLAVDLAAKYSAACLMSSDGLVLSDWDSFEKPEADFVTSLIRPFLFGVGPDAIIIEDLPHRVPHNSTVKAVSRLQGRIFDRFDRLDSADLVVFVDPQTWRRHYSPALKNGTGPEAVLDVAAERGYEFPADLAERTKGKGGKTLARKIATDYCAAFLIATWATAMRWRWDHYDVPGTSRYGHQQIRKS